MVDTAVLRIVRVYLALRALVMQKSRGPKSTYIYLGEQE